MYTANHDDAKKRPGSRTLGPWKQRDVLDGSRVSNGVGRGEIRRKFYLFTTNKLKKEKRRQGKRKEKRTEKQTSSFRWYRVWYWVWIPFGHSRNISGKRINLELKKKKNHLKIFSHPQCSIAGSIAGSIAARERLKRYR